MSSTMPLYRRHKQACKYFKKPGHREAGCRCPIHLDAYINGVRKPFSLKTNNWGEAEKKAAAYLSGDLAPSVTLRDAIDAWKKNLITRNVAETTQDHYHRLLERQFLPAMEARGYSRLDQITLALIEEFRDNRTRALRPTTQATERQILKVFFGFAKKRGMISSDPTENSDPVELRESEVRPYEQGEINRILFACEQLPKACERPIARAAVLMMRWTGLRISDVAASRRDQVKNGAMMIFTIKNRRSIFLPIPRELQFALDTLPLPAGSESGNPFYFWNGQESPQKAYWRLRWTLDRVYTLSGVKDAKNHRFRHTFVSEGLAAGMTEREMADIVGVSEGVLRKHYSRWMSGRQDRITEAMNKFHGFVAGKSEPEPEAVDMGETKGLVQ